MSVYAVTSADAVQPVFYAELFGARVRYTGSAASRETGAALAGFSPFIAAALLGYADGDPWLVALFMAATAAISLVAFLYSRESRLTDVGLAEHAPASPGGSGAGRARALNRPRPEPVLLR